MLFACLSGRIAQTCSVLDSRKTLGQMDPVRTLERTDTDGMPLETRSQQKKYPFNLFLPM